VPGPRKFAPVLAVAALLAIASAAQGSQLPNGFRDQIVFSGLEEPTAIRFAPGGPVYVAEKSGEVLAYSGLGDAKPTVFADLRTEVNDSFDRGILGLAVDPGFPARPYVYVLYTYDHILGAPAGEVPKWGKEGQSGDGCEEKPSGTGVDACPDSGRLVRLTADAVAGYEKAVTAAGKPEGKVLVEGWCQQFSSHSIGDLRFGPEGALYASGGEGANANSVDYGELGWPSKNECGDPPAGIGGTEKPPGAEGGALRAQDARTPNPTGASSDPTGLSGSVIRIDPDSGEGWPGNPLATSLDANERRLVGYGFRNPFRFAIDPAGGALYVDNVGWNNYEEIDRFKPSSSSAYNSGWPCYEGPFRQSSYESLGLTLCKNLYAEPSTVTAPFFYYSHSSGVVLGDPCPHADGSAISGNTIYRGGAFPSEYEGALFFADSVRGCIYVIPTGAGGQPDPAKTAPFLTNGGQYPGIDLEVGPEGDLYYVSLFSESTPGEEFGPGAVHRVSYIPDVPVVKLKADQISGPSSFTAHLDASESSSASGEPLEFEWDLDGNGSFETKGGSEQATTVSGTENVEVAVRVTDPGTLGSDVAKLTLYPGDTPPVPTIETPQDEGLAWRVSQAIPFAGSATDAQDGPLAAGELSWKSLLYHCPQSAENCHVHPLQEFAETASGTLIAPDHDYPSRIELILTAVDSRGLAASRSVQLLPLEVDLQLLSDPPGLSLSAGVASKVAPFTLPAIAGGGVTLSAPLTQELGGRTYTWQRWSDGGDRVHSVTAAATTYTAVYSTPPLPMPPETLPALPRLALPGTKLWIHPPSQTSNTSATFKFSSGGRTEAARFECKLDDAPWRPCRSPRVYRNIAPGRHVVRIRAVGTEGTVDPTPVLFKWKVLP
jgi:glucose/arabinose dehydrogenase